MSKLKLNDEVFLTFTNGNIERGIVTHIFEDAYYKYVVTIDNGKTKKQFYCREDDIRKAD